MTRMHITTAIRIAVVAAALSALAAPTQAQEQQAKSAAFATRSQRQAARDAAYYARVRQANDAYVDHADPDWPNDVATPGVSYATGLTPPRSPYRDAFAWDGFGGTVYDNGSADYHGAGFNGGRFSPLYAARNHFACLPGTLFTGEDGRRHVCQ
ncbi:MAG: hypothetical protein ABWY18_19450 [Tardiphaga sp.]